MLAEVEVRLQEVSEGTDGFLRTAAQGMIARRGKRLRPTIVLLAAECAGSATESSLALATAVEMIHTASLVHDDVVDGSSLRRGGRSANAEWGNKVSVLLGDYLLAQALSLLPREGSEQLLSELVVVAKQMCRGQIQELLGAGREISEAEYLEIIRAKTGELFGFCGRAGAETGGGSAEVAAALGWFGKSFGTAFQLADDILDLVGSDGRSGKPVGEGGAGGQYTLPLIFAAQRGGREARERLARVLAAEARLAERDVSAEELAAVRELAEATGAIDAAWEEVEGWLGQARERLRAVPDNDAKRALVALAGDRFPMPVMS